MISAMFDNHDMVTRRLDRLWRMPQAPQRAVGAGERLIGLATQLGERETISIQIDTTTPAGTVLAVRAPQRMAEGNDLEWALAPVGQLQPLTRPTGPQTPERGAPAQLWEVRPLLDPTEMGWPEAGAEGPDPAAAFMLPVGHYDDLHELVPALADAGAVVRIHLGPATGLEAQMLREVVAASLPAHAVTAYLGTPVRARLLIGLPPAGPSARLRVLVDNLGQGLELARIDTHPVVATGATPRPARSVSVWQGSPESLIGYARPHGVAQLLVRVPAAGVEARLSPITAVLPPTPPVPLTDVLPHDGLVIGQALDPAGTPVEVHLAGEDLLRHLQVIGASGTGKTSFLAGLVVSAADHGLGATVLSPHPDLTDRLLTELAPSAAARTLVVRSGDPDGVVPLNPTATGSDTSLETLMDVFQDLLDPHHTGMFGLRAQRLVTLAMRALRVLAGQRACLPAAALIYQDQDLVRRLAATIARTDPDLGADLLNEVAALSASEYAELIGWFRSRFHRLIGSQPMRAILATGADAIDVTGVIDNHQLLLIDLASTRIGASSAQLLGEMWLAKHWDALARRADPRQPHLLIVDEAHLFGAGLLPRLLAEGRKFGIGVVLAHQHLHQLDTPLREAAQSNASSLLAFRTGPTEAAATAGRLGDWDGADLSRLPNLTAAATLSTRHAQTAPFTLTVTHNDTARHDTGLAAAITTRSRRTLTDPYTHLTPITPTDIKTLATTTNTPAGGQHGTGATFLDEWLQRRQAHTPTGQPTPTLPPDLDDARLMGEPPTR